MTLDEMVLVHTSIWADHIDRSDATLQRLLDDNRVLMHPHVIGELAMGNLKRRHEIIAALQLLPQAVVAQEDEMLRLIEMHSLYGRGIGYVDAHLLTSVQLTRDARLWSRDRRLREAAEKLKLDYKK